LVGGSLTHGHQQIAFSNIMPRRFHNNWSFFERRKELFSSYMLRKTSPELLIRDYGEAVLLVPYFMRRPYDMLLILKDVRKQYLCELTPAELVAVAKGWHDATRAILTIMPRIGKATAYNVTVNNGPGAGLYVEFLPYTQETGGFEHLGLWVCQDNPQNVASNLNEILDGT
jgi:galactose-1-phosphate uridylyltransferase